jgi:hypothetical protein
MELIRFGGGWAILENGHADLLTQAQELQGGCLLVPHSARLYHLTNYKVSSVVCGACYLVPFSQATQSPILPGEGGTVEACTLSTFLMGDGADRQTVVIKDGRVMRYVGIGWVEERQAVQADADTMPVVTYRLPHGEHMARV